MSHKPSEAHYVEGVHRFWIDEGYVVCRIECSDYYARQAQNFCGGCKEMDFLLYHPERRDLWLVEVKDYRFDARPKVGELVCAPAVTDGKLITGTSAGCAVPFGLALIAALKGQAAAQAVAEQIVIR